MMALVEPITNFGMELILFSSLILEFFGAAIIIFFAIGAFVNYLRQPSKEETIRLALAKKLALGLQFLLGAEILGTVIVRTINEIIVLAAILVLRGILGYVVHSEIRSLEGEGKQTQ